MLPRLLPFPRIVLLLLLLLGLSEAFTSQATTCSSPSIHHPAKKPAFSNNIHKTPLHHDEDSRPSPTALAMNRGTEIQGTKNRILSCLPYLLPLMDGDRYGRFIFATIPPLGMADALLLGPFKLVYFAIPFGQFIAFLGLSFLSRNPEISRPIRYNMQQALILDILLIFPSLLGRLPFAMPRILVESGSNFVFYALVAAVGYALFSNLTGKVPNQIPLVSEATEAQIGPF